MVGMVVVRPRCQHQVGIPLANLADDLLADVERRHQLAVVVVEDDVLDADAAAGFLRFGTAPRRERATTLGLVTRVAVGDGDESHAMAEGGVLRAVPPAR